MQSVETSLEENISNPIGNVAGTDYGGKTVCFHCGTPCGGGDFTSEEKVFCCRGCQTVFELLTSSGLSEFYEFEGNPGLRIAQGRADSYQFLDEPPVRELIVDFHDGKLTRVTFHLPAIHCAACVWLLENLFRLKSGVGNSTVNFLRKELALSLDPSKVGLSEVASLLSALGYPPELKLASLDNHSKAKPNRRLWIQLGLAGFAFGNIMLFSISAYLGLDAFAGPGFRTMVGAISLGLTLPVITYSAVDYWRAAWSSVRQRLLNIDVPIAVGIAAIFARSAYEVVGGVGDGYFDSLCGLIFFLLCGRLFQKQTYDRLAFDRDYKSFFPLAVTRKVRSSSESLELQRSQPCEQVSLSQLQVGDRLILRNGELIPADAKLVNGTALIDYSFVTGESEPVEKGQEDHLYAGGRQMGPAIEIETVKAVSQGYLTALWNQDVFKKEKCNTLNALTNTYSQRFTKLIFFVGLGAAAYWGFVDPAISIKAFVSVLIVACPCALALAAPFALGTAQRFLARRNIFLKNPYVLETLAKINSIVFDKTGTLTTPTVGAVQWQGAGLTDEEKAQLFSITRHSTHPLAVRIGSSLAARQVVLPVHSFREIPGCGMEGTVAGREIWIGSRSWLGARVNGHTANQIAETAEPLASVVHLAVDGKYRGAFLLQHALRPEMEAALGELQEKMPVTLLSGDNQREQEKFARLFGSGSELHFNQSPVDKLEFVRQRQDSGAIVMMVGDGLNDAGALKQSNVGVAVVENINAFSPASDVILGADMVARLPALLEYSKSSVRIVRAAFLISALYNLVGIAIAASGKLSPIVCAILMPVSSITVVIFACGMATWIGNRIFRGSKE